MLLRLSYILSLVAFGCYFVDAFAGRRTVAVDWVLPLAAFACLFLIPATWIAFVRARRREEGVRLWPQIALLPFWLHSVFTSIAVIGWIAVGGL